ncbi:TPA: hypothetical protein EYP66_21870 [Candidatus Poribacteria bacterium]|nr:hypothetical protein [Candidatus Poribacteria bacterium]
MKARLEWVRGEYPDRIIQLGAEIVLAEKMTKDLLEKISRIVIENISSSKRNDIKTCHVYIYAGYEFLNFIQRFLSESEEILSFEAIQGIIR